MVTYIRDAQNELSVDLGEVFIGKIRLPLYMEPDDPEHENPALTAIFNTALRRVAKTLAEFDDNHPVVRDFNEYFSTKKLVQRHREAVEWMKKLGLAVTPELEAVLTEPQLTLLKDNELTHLKEPERHRRVMGVGSVLLQLLAIQTELGEPLNLNGDLVADLRDRAVVACSSDGVEALQAMFTAVPLSAKTVSVALKHMLQFNRAHTVYDTDFRPPMYRRDSPSYSESTEAIPILVKRRGDEEMSEERPKKRAKRPNRKPPATTVEADSGKGGRKLRPRKVRQS
ncbi:hypothetical protein FB451DRAFT_1534719 [Mycena latifolia]|nr:hypothetical protein FB451DRAFT_1534719 [Mycena latifolia]